MLRRYSADFHDVGELIDLVLAWIDWIASVQLCYYAAKAPHVNCHCVGYAQNDLGSPIEPGLNIRIYPLTKEAGAAIVNDFDAALVLLLQEDVLGL